MALGDFLEAVRGTLATALSPVPKTLGGAYPIDGAELPAVALSAAGVTPGPIGIGRIPRATSRGALRIQTSVALDNPVLVFSDSTVRLLSSDRRTLQLPHSPLVTADGGEGPLGGADLQISLGATTFTVVAGTPGPGEVQADATTGIMTFGDALAPAGDLRLGYSIGTWESQVLRYQGLLTVEVFADDAAGVESLSQALGSALREEVPARVAGLNRIFPTAWSAISPPDPQRANARARTLTYQFDFELEKPLVTTGGGLIAGVLVDSTPGPEQFEVSHQKGA